MTDTDSLQPGADALEALLTRSALGDRNAFNTLYEATSARLFAVLVRICSQRQLAEDILHDSYLRIWQRAGDYRRAQGAPLTWMISIARYRAIDVLRRENRRITNAEFPELPAPSSERPDAQASDKESAAALENCLDQLGDQQQRSLRLAYLSGLTYQQTAARVGSPLGTVKSWIRRGLGALRDCLEGPQALGQDR